MEVKKTAEREIRFRVDLDVNKANKQMAALKKNIFKTEESINASGEQHNALAEQLEAATQEAIKTYERVEEIKKAMAENQKILEFNKSGANIGIDEFIEANERQQALNAELKEKEKLLAQQEAAAQKLDAKDAEILKKMEQQTAELKKQQIEAGNLQMQIDKEESALRVQDSVKSAKASLAKDSKMFLRYVIGARTIYAAFNMLKNAIKQGVTEFAKYDSEAQGAISRLKSSLSTLTLSWGAAFAPIITAVEPLLQRLIGWLTKAANAVTAFFAALSGKNSYKKVIAGTADLSHNLSSGAAAAKEMKRQLMGFDQLNVMQGQDTNGGGGGGGGGGTGGAITEETAVPTKIKGIVQWLLDKLPIIKTLAVAVGAAFAAWKIGKLFAQFPTLFKSLKTILGIAGTIYGTWMLMDGVFDAIENGVNWDNLKKMLLGTTILVAGLALAFGLTAAKVGLLVASVVMLVQGLRDWITTGELSTETLVLMEAALLGIGVAISAITCNWIPLLITLIAGAVLAIVKYWDDIKQAFIDTWQEVKESAKSDIEAIKGFFVGLWTSVKEVFGKILDWITSTFNRIKNIAIEICKAIGQGIKNIFIGAVNAVISIIEHAINSMIGGLNRLLSHINNIGAIFGRSWSLRISPVSLPRLAKGGIVDGAQAFVAGEAGKEAIIPLERHTEWISMVAGELKDMLFDGRISTVLSGVKDELSAIRISIDRLAQLRDVAATVPMPAVVMGTVAPPRAVGYGDDTDSLRADMAELKQTLREFYGLFRELMPESNRKVQKILEKPIASIDGRQIRDSLDRYDRARGR